MAIINETLIDLPDYCIEPDAEFLRLAQLRNQAIGTDGVERSCKYLPLVSFPSVPRGPYTDVSVAIHLALHVVAIVRIGVGVGHQPIFGHDAADTAREAQRHGLTAAKI